MTTPPAGYPPIELTAAFADHPDGPLGAGEVRGGRLRISASADSWSSTAFDPRSFRDNLVIASISLAEGGDEDLAGLTVRQSSAASWCAYAVSPAGRVVVATMDADGYRRVADGQLGPDIPFERGVGSVNELGVLACGPSLVFIANGAIVTAVFVSPALAEGDIGLYVENRSKAERAEAAAEWFQVRAILPER